MREWRKWPTYNSSRFNGSAPPLTAEAASLIDKETPALRSHIQGVQNLNL